MSKIFPLHVCLVKKEFAPSDGVRYILEQLKNANIYANAAFSAKTLFGFIPDLPLTICKSMVKKLIYS